MILISTKNGDIRNNSFKKKFCFTPVNQETQNEYTKPYWLLEQDIMIYHTNVLEKAARQNHSRDFSKRGAHLICFKRPSLNQKRKTYMHDCPTSCSLCNPIPAIIQDHILTLTKKKNQCIYYN